MSRSIAGVVGLAAAIAVVSFSTSARADDNHEKAGAAFQEGRRYLEQGNCDAAITKLKESLSYESSVGARLSIADCYEKSDPLLAWRNLKEAASLAYFNHDERVAVAEQRAAALEKTLPTLRVTLPPGAIDTPGFELRVDGELLDRFYYRTGVIATKPGTHVVEVTAPMRHFRGEATAAPGMYANVAVRLEHDACTGAQGTTTVATAAPPERGSTRKTLGLAIAGVGVLGVAVGGVFGAITLDKKSTISALCGGNPGSCAAPPGSVDSERNAAKTDATISTIAFIAGGAALVGGGVLYFTAPSANATTGTNVRVAPSVGANGGGALVTGSF